MVTNARKPKPPFKSFPQTGDRSNTSLYGAILALLAMLLLVARAKKRTMEN